MKQNVSKRLLLHSDADILSLVTAHSADIKTLQTNMTKNIGEIQAVQKEVATMKTGLATKGNFLSHCVLQGKKPNSDTQLLHDKKRKLNLIY